MLGAIYIELQTKNIFASVKIKLTVLMREGIIGNVVWIRFTALFVYSIGMIKL